MDQSTGAIKSWKFSSRGIAWRLFFTCWLIYGLHFATNIVREIYPALALGDSFSFRLDEYANLHPDIFEKPGYGWHINNNPGVSFFAAIPYTLARPLIDQVVMAVNQSRQLGGQNQPPAYDSPWPMAQEFYAEAWRRGYDVKFALAAFVMQSFFMAPLTALSAVAIFYSLRTIFRSDKAGLGLALLYAFGTPVFFRSGTLNQNLALGIVAFFGFLLLWNEPIRFSFSPPLRYFLAGVCGGLAVFFDYSGSVLLVGLFLYGLIKVSRTGLRHEALHYFIYFFLGFIGPLSLLWFYQWKSFGNPFLPAQHWMTATSYSGFGYQGIGLPQLDLIVALAIDLRYGIFTSAPIMLLALFVPLIDRGRARLFPAVETYFILGLFLAFWIFCSANNFSRLQFNSGVRYMTSLIPFLFLLAAVTFIRLPAFIQGFIVVFSLFQSWSLAIYRDVENSLGVINPLLKLLLGGIQLPIFITLSRLQDQFKQLLPAGFSPGALLVLAAAILFVIWWPRTSKSGQLVDHTDS